MTLRLSEDETTKEITALRRTVSTFIMLLPDHPFPSACLKKFKADLKIEPQQVQAPSIPWCSIFYLV